MIDDNQKNIYLHPSLILDWLGYGLRSNKNNIGI